MEYSQILSFSIMEIELKKISSHSFDFFISGPLVSLTLKISILDPKNSLLVSNFSSNTTPTKQPWHHCTAFSTVLLRR